MKRNILASIGALLVLVLCVTFVAPTTAKAAAKVEKTTISSVKASGKNGIKVTWKSVDGADGYAVYRKTASDSKYVKVGSTSKTKLTDKKWSASEGSDISYIVKAYKMVNGKKVYSAASKAKTYSVPSASGSEIAEFAKTATWDNMLAGWAFYRENVKYFVDKKGTKHELAFYESWDGMSAYCKDGYISPTHIFDSDWADFCLVYGDTAYEKYLVLQDTWYDEMYCATTPKQLYGFKADGTPILK